MLRELTVFCIEILCCCGDVKNKEVYTSAEIRPLNQSLHLHSHLVWSMSWHCSSWSSGKTGNSIGTNISLPPCLVILLVNKGNWCWSSCRVIWTMPAEKIIKSNAYNDSIPRMHHKEFIRTQKLKIYFHICGYPFVCVCPCPCVHST